MAILTIFLSSCAKDVPSFKQGDAEGELKNCIWLLQNKKFEDGVQCLEILKARHPGSMAARDAELAVGDAYFRKKDYLSAVEAYQSFVRLYPTHPKVGYAYYKIGLSYLKESPKAIDRDQTYLFEAERYLKISISRFGDTNYHALAKKYLNDTRLRLAKREFYIGRFYYRTGEYISSVPRFRAIVEEYPDAGLNEKSLYYMTIASIRLKELEDARVSFTMLSTKFPSSKFTKKAEGKLIRASEKENKKSE